MDLKEFIKISLQQIVEGVSEAQGTELGGNINASNYGVPAGKNVFSANDLGMFTLVEFDVAVSAETTGKGDANLKVFGVGVGGGGEHKAGSANRIAFAVPVRLPDGDKSRYEERKRRESSALNRTSNWQAV
jgi:hypothetical protein